MVDLNEDSINLRALKRIDDNIREIIICAGQVAVYYFDFNREDWERKNIEGTLFFVRRSIVPEYAFVVINRLNTINFLQKITKDLEINVQSPYLMYKNINKDIYCIWFYDANQCIVLNENIDQVRNLIKKTSDTPSKLMNGQSHTPKSRQQLASTGTTPNNNQQQASEIMKLFFNNNNNNNNTNTNDNQQSQQGSLGIFGDSALPPPDLMKQRWLQNQSTENHIDNVSSEQQQQQQKSDDDLVKPIAQRRSVNLKELFESQLVLQETSNTSMKENSQHIAADDNNSQSLIDKPQSSTPKTVKQTPNKNELLMSSSPSMNSATFMTDDLKKKSLTSLPTSNANPSSSNSMSDGIYTAKPQQLIGDDILQDEPQQMMHNVIPAIHPSLFPIPMNFEPGFQQALLPAFHAQPPPQPPPQPPLPQQVSNHHHLANCITNVFEIQQDHNPIIGHQQQQQQQPITQNTGRTSISKPDMYLTMEQLKKALIHCLTNDADFLHAIHTAYVENIKK